MIDEEAHEFLSQHGKSINRQGQVFCQRDLWVAAAHWICVAPLAVEIASLDILKREVFGPILHVVRYKSKDLDKVIEAINHTGYGLTLGIHTRIDSVADYIQSHLRVGNAYVNRNMIGAVVGVQPFGGQGLSGTGPKAGGPNYLHRFAVERTLTINSAAVGGNATLLSLGDE